MVKARIGASLLALTLVITTSMARILGETIDYARQGQREAERVTRKK